MRVLVFGDSITQGFWDAHGGWVERLRKHYDIMQIKDLNADFPTIFNLGISGNNSGDVLKRIRQETVTRMQYGARPAVLVQIGVNDSYLESGKPKIRPDDYRKNLEMIIEIANGVASQVVLVGLSACDESRTRPVSWKNCEYLNELIKQNENLMSEVATQTNTPFIPIFDKFLEFSKREDILADGLHPNDAGHEFIFRIVLDKVQNLLS